jgi:hypothetical protein
MLLASTMTGKGIHLVVELVSTAYQTGVKLSKETMDVVEARLTVRANPAHTTSKLAIIIMSSCSRLWQWKTYLPR